MKVLNYPSVYDADTAKTLGKYQTMEDADPETHLARAIQARMKATAIASKASGRTQDPQLELDAILQHLRQLPLPDHWPSRSPALPDSDLVRALHAHLVASSQPNAPKYDGSAVLALAVILEESVKARTEALGRHAMPLDAQERHQKSPPSRYSPPWGAIADAPINPTLARPRSVRGPEGRTRQERMSNPPHLQC